MAFAGDTAVVTGATSGIGRALSLALVEAGARVLAVGRSSDRLGLLVRDAAGASGAIVSVLADFERDGAAQSAAAAILAETESVDVLVHGAGVIWLGSPESAPRAEIDRLQRVNLRTPVDLTNALMDALRRARGHVVFLNSTAALAASAENGEYAATKQELRAFADGLREEVESDGVRVLSLFLGRTDTPMQRAVHEHEGRAYRPELLMRAEDVVHVVLAALALPVSAELTEVVLRPAARLPR